MGTRLLLSCDGCDAKAEGERISKEFVSFSGRSYGFGRRVFTKRISETAPDGWVPWDPYTDCCYCAQCWAGIEKPVAP